MADVVHESYCDYPNCNCVKVRESGAYEACPEAAHHGNPFLYCPVKGCGWTEDPEPEYRCNCGQTFPEHLARVAHMGSCQVMAKYREVADLERRIERTVEYACEIVAATEDPNVLIAMDAVVKSLRTPTSQKPEQGASS